MQQRQRLSSRVTIVAATSGKKKKNKQKSGFAAMCKEQWRPYVAPAMNGDWGAGHSRPAFVGQKAGEGNLNQEINFFLGHGFGLTDLG